MCSLVGVWKLKVTSPLVPESASEAVILVTVAPEVAPSLTLAI